MGRELPPGELRPGRDPVLIREGLTRRHTGHDDHIHVRYYENVHPVAAYDC